MAQNRYALGLMDWRDNWWDFTGDWAAGIKSGGVEGLVGSVEDSTAQTLGGGGQVVLAQHVAPARGAVTFHCRSHNGVPADEVQAMLRQAFSPLKSRRSALRLSSLSGPVEAAVRLSGPIPPPVEDPTWDDELVLNVQVPLVIDEGPWWFEPLSRTGSVTVTNHGDVPVWVKIRWSGAGGPVIMPSGATFTLPAVAAERVLFLSRHDSMVVKDAAGVVDRVAWAAVSGAYPESVPAGETRTFTVPDGARVEWRVGVLDPWL